MPIYKYIGNEFYGNSPLRKRGIFLFVRYKGAGYSSFGGFLYRNLGGLFQGYGNPLLIVEKDQLPAKEARQRIFLPRFLPTDFQRVFLLTNPKYLLSSTASSLRPPIRFLSKAFFLGAELGSLPSSHGCMPIDIRLWISWRRSQTVGFFFFLLQQFGLVKGFFHYCFKSWRWTS